MATPPRRRRIATISLLVAAAAGASVPLLSGGSEWEPNVGFDKAITVAVGDLDVEVRRVPGEHANAIVLHLRLSDHEGEPAAPSGYTPRYVVWNRDNNLGSQIQPCTVPRGAQFWECAYIVDMPSVWRFNFVMLQGGVTVSSFQVVVATPDAVDAENHGAPAPMNRGSEPDAAVWFASGIGLAALGAGLRARRRARGASEEPEAIGRT
jgi:hypothetical protein